MIPSCSLYECTSCSPVTRLIRVKFAGHRTRSALIPGGKHGGRQIAVVK